MTTIIERSRKREMGEGDLPALGRWGKIKGAWKRGIGGLASPPDLERELMERHSFAAPVGTKASFKMLRMWNAKRNIRISELMLKELRSPDVRRRLLEGVNPYAKGVGFYENAPEMVGRAASVYAITSPVVREEVTKQVAMHYRKYYSMVWRGAARAVHTLNTYPGMMLGFGAIGAFLGHKAQIDPAAAGAIGAATGAGIRLAVRAEGELGHRLRALRPAKFYVREQLAEIAHLNLIDSKAGREIVEKLPEMLEGSRAGREEYLNTLRAAVDASRFRGERRKAQEKIGRLFKGRIKNA